jgi:hypothetical protein
MSDRTLQTIASQVRSVAGGRGRMTGHPGCNALQGGESSGPSMSEALHRGEERHDTLAAPDGPASGTHCRSPGPNGASLGRRPCPTELRRLRDRRLARGRRGRRHLSRAPAVAASPPGRHQGDQGGARVRDLLPAPRTRDRGAPSAKDIRTSSNSSAPAWSA